MSLELRADVQTSTGIGIHVVVMPVVMASEIVLHAIFAVNQEIIVSVEIAATVVVVNVLLLIVVV